MVMLYVLGLTLSRGSCPVHEIYLISWSKGAWTMCSMLSFMTSLHKDSLAERILGQPVQP